MFSFLCVFLLASCAVKNNLPDRATKPSEFFDADIPSYDQLEYVEYLKRWYEAGDYEIRDTETKYALYNALYDLKLGEETEFDEKFHTDVFYLYFKDGSQRRYQFSDGLFKTEDGRYIEVVSGYDIVNKIINVITGQEGATWEK